MNLSRYLSSYSAPSRSIAARKFSWNWSVVHSWRAYPMILKPSSRSRCSSASSAGNSKRAARSPDAPSTTSVGSLLTRSLLSTAPGRRLGAPHVAREIAEDARVEDPLGETPHAVGLLEAVEI